MYTSWMRLLILTIGGINSASSRYRIMQFIPSIEKSGIKTTLLEAEELSQKTTSEITDICKSHPVIFIQKKLFNAKLLNLLSQGSKIIFDLDDAIWTSEKPRSFLTNIKVKSKFKNTISKCSLVVTGNNFLKDYCEPLSQSQVITVPTVLNTNHYPKKNHLEKSTITIGWIGSHKNFKYLDSISEALKEIQSETLCAIKVIADKPYFNAQLDIDFQAWDLTREIEYVNSFDIGIMPLLNDEWSQGKCAFKAIQCMAAGLPVVVSPYGENKNVVRDNLDGFHATTISEWIHSLKALIQDMNLRVALGANARQRVIASYSLNYAEPILTKFVEKLIVEQ